MTPEQKNAVQATLDHITEIVERYDDVDYDLRKDLTSIFPEEIEIPESPAPVPNADAVIREIAEMSNKLRMVKSHVVCTDEQFDEGGDELNELPSVNTTDKNATFFINTLVMKVENGIVHCRERWESNDDYKFPVDDLGWGEIIFLYKHIFGGDVPVDDVSVD